MNKKNFIASISAIVFACFSLSLSADDITDDATIKIEGLSASDASSSGITHGSGTNNYVKLIVPDYTGLTGARSVEWETVNCQCFDITSGTDTYNAALFANNEVGYNETNYPYIQIEPAAGTVITHIAFKGLTISDDMTYLSYGFSSGTGTALTDNQFTATSIMPPLPIMDQMFMQKNANVCILAKLATTADNGKIAVPLDKQTIRLAASKLFPTGTPLTGNNVKPWNLLGVYVWTNGSGTSIQSVNDNSFQAYVSNGELNLSKPAAQISLYSISGTLVKTAENTQNVSLEELPLGVYIVKALSNTGKTLVTKIAR